MSRNRNRVSAGLCLSLALIAASLCSCPPATGARLVSVTTLGEGTVAPAVGVHQISDGTMVSLDATPREGWRFERWDGAVDATTPHVEVMADRNLRVTAIFAPETPAPENALVRYVAKADDVYAWSELSSEKGPFWTSYTFSLTSQRWRTSDEVNRPVWTHGLSVVRPKSGGETCVLLINGGSNRNKPPSELEPGFGIGAVLLGVSYAQLDQIPNQPLVFADEAGKERKEDEILAYSLDKYLSTGDDEWPVHLAMAKAAVRAMDAIQERFPDIKDFVVTGGSKRGWTTYLVAAVDPRVRAMAPLSIDVPNMPENLRNHWEAYGFYTDAVQDYVDFNLFCRFDTPEGQALLKIVDPYSYFDKYTMPKLVAVSAGDQFFPTDSSRFYWSELPGPKWLHVGVNTDHSQEQALIPSLLDALSWTAKIINDKPLPAFDWTFLPEGGIRVETQTKPRTVKLWKATNPAVRDFRLETIGSAWTSTPLTDQGGGVYVGYCDPPAQGWTAYLVELTFDDHLAFTTEVVVTPEMLPFEGTACMPVR